MEWCLGVCWVSDTRKCLFRPLGKIQPHVDVAVLAFDENTGKALRGRPDRVPAEG